MATWQKHVQTVDSVQPSCPPIALSLWHTAVCAAVWNQTAASSRTIARLIICQAFPIIDGFKIPIFLRKSRAMTTYGNGERRKPQQRELPQSEAVQL